MMYRATENIVQFISSEFLVVNVLRFFP